MIWPWSRARRGQQVETLVPGEGVGEMASVPIWFMGSREAFPLMLKGLLYFYTLNHEVRVCSIIYDSAVWDNDSSHRLPGRALSSTATPSPLKPDGLPWAWPPPPTHPSGALHGVGMQKTGTFWNFPGQRAQQTNGRLPSWYSLQLES